MLVRTSTHTHTHKKSVCHTSHVTSHTSSEEEEEEEEEEEDVTLMDGYIPNTPTQSVWVVRGGVGKEPFFMVIPLGPEKKKPNSHC